MEEVAKMLGVEMGENFRISTSNREFFITISGLHSVGEEYEPCAKFENETLFLQTLKGNIEIIKLPFLPKEGDIYYSYMWSEPLRGAVIVNTMFVSSDAQCRSDYMLGNCYRTKAECEADTAMKERIENLERCKW